MSFWISFERNPLYFVCKNFRITKLFFECFKEVSAIYFLPTFIKSFSNRRMKGMSAPERFEKSFFLSFYKWILKPFTIFLITSQYNNLEKQKLQWSSRLPDASRWIFLKVNGLEFSFSAIDAGVFTKLLKWVVVNLMDIMNHEDRQGKGPGLSSHFKNSQMKPRTFSRIFAGIHER